MRDTKDLDDFDSLETSEAPASRSKALPPFSRKALQPQTILARLSAPSALRNRILIAAGMIVGIVVISYLLGIPQWMKQRRETHQWVVANKLTPESLIARCGAPLSDNTRDLYPMIARELTYKSSGSGTVVLKFSRTSEEGSDWVFMSMQDVATGAAIETPVAKISALGCLDSSK